MTRKCLLTLLLAACIGTAWAQEKTPNAWRQMAIDDLEFIRDTLQAQHPGTVVYALIGKIIIVYSALVFVLWQFRPEPKTSAEKLPDTPPEVEPPPPHDRPSALEDIESHDKLKTRYDRILSKK